MASEEFSTPGQCCVGDCEVALVVEGDSGWSRLFACKHKLARLSEYFNTLLCGNFKEKNKKEVTLQDVSKAQLLPFLRWLSAYPDALKLTDCESLCSLVTLADRFLCSELEKQILKVLSDAQVPVFNSWLGSYRKIPSPPRDLDSSISSISSISSSDDDDLELKPPAPIPRIAGFGADAKLKLLEVAEMHKGTGGSILEACVKRCGDLEIDQVAPLHGKLSAGTLAALYYTIGRGKDVTLSKFKPVRGGPCCKRARMNLRPIGFGEFKKIKIDKNLFST